MPEYYIGTSGWYYDHWKGLFYPEVLPKRKWLEYYSGQFNTIEINNSFYRLPTEKAFQQWYDTTPPDFKYAVKASRGITHIRRLKNTEDYLNNLVKRASLLKNKLAIMLFQLPPQMKINIKRLETFLNSLPPSQKSVFEFRHASWTDDPVFSVLNKYKAGFCVYDMPGYTTPVIATSDFAYIRFHGNKDLYLSSYSDRELKEWARKIKGFPPGVKEVYVYFNNDAGGSAIANAVKLKELLVKPG